MSVNKYHHFHYNAFNVTLNKLQMSMELPLLLKLM